MFFKSYLLGFVKSFHWDAPLRNAIDKLKKRLYPN